MITHYQIQQRYSWAYRSLCGFVALVFCINAVIVPGVSYAQLNPATVAGLPAPGTMVSISPVYTPALMNGMVLDAQNPLKFDFLIETGDDHLQGEALRQESQKLVHYFMAALTVPEDQLWVNLSPYEKNRIVADGLGETAMGRDMLAQDYLLKQLSASLMYPEEELGKKFWKRIRKELYEKFGSAEIPQDLFNKIWIIPQRSEIYVHDNTIFITESHLKVLLEEDYLALEHHDRGMDDQAQASDLKEETKKIVREILLPEIEREVNEGKNFAPLRQMFHALILATWYKRNLKESVLGRVYADQNKIGGVALEDKEAKLKIYDQYIESFKKGVYDYIKEEYDPSTQDIIPRKYFSGGADFVQLPLAETDAAMAPLKMLSQSRNPYVTVTVETPLTLERTKDSARPAGSFSSQASVELGEASLGSAERRAAPGRKPGDRAMVAVYGPEVITDIPFRNMAELEHPPLLSDRLIEELSLKGLTKEALLKAVGMINRTAGESFGLSSSDSDHW